MCAPKYWNVVKRPDRRSTKSQNSFQWVVNIKVGIWVYITREAEICLLVIRDFYSKNKTEALKKHLTGNDKGKDLGHNGKAHILTMPNSSFPTKPSSFSMAFYMRKSNRTADFILTCCVIDYAVSFGCFLLLLDYDAFSLQSPWYNRKHSTEEYMTWKSDWRDVSNEERNKSDQYWEENKQGKWCSQLIAVLSTAAE